MYGDVVCNHPVEDLRLNQDTVHLCVNIVINILPVAGSLLNGLEKQILSDGTDKLVRVRLSFTSIHAVVLINLYSSFNRKCYS